jgi:hypothetical protein
MAKVKTEPSTLLAQKQAFTTDAEQLEALRIPFPLSEIRTREQGGATLHYYEAYTVQQRLLDVLGTGLSIITGQVISTETNVNTEVILNIEWVSGRKSTISGWGSSDIIISGKSGKLVNDPYKASATDGIKVAASKLGVAGELYDSKYREGLKVRMAAQEEEEAERAFLTCQNCNGEINNGSITKADGTPFALTAKEVAVSTRKKFGQRLCIGCAEVARSNA